MLREASGDYMKQDSYAEPVSREWRLFSVFNKVNGV